MLSFYIINTTRRHYKRFFQSNAMQSDNFHINTNVMRMCFYCSSYVAVLMKLNGKYHVSTVIWRIFCAIYRGISSLSRRNISAPLSLLSVLRFQLKGYIFKKLCLEILEIYLHVIAIMIFILKFLWFSNDDGYIKLLINII